MIYAFTPEQDELRSTARKFFAEYSTEADVRALMESSAGFDPEVWRRLAEDLGLVGLAVPEKYGGAGYGLAEIGVVLEEAGRALLCSPFFATSVLAVTALLGCQDAQACDDYLPAIASGQLRATVAVLEDSGRWDEAAVESSAARTSNGWVLDGHKSYVLDGESAELLLVAARTPKGIGLFAVEADADGLTRVPLVTLDATRKQARVKFDAVPGRLLGDAADGWRVVSQILDHGAAALAAEQTGGAVRTLEMSVEYAKLRYQFGRPIGSFQAIKHRCADMLAEVERARSAAYQALWLADDRETEAFGSAASIAKAVCSEAYLRCASDNIQIHGGIGFTWEHSAHLYFRRAKSSQGLFGTPAYHRDRAARSLGI